MKHNIQLTINEWRAVGGILNEVNEHLIWNKENDWYEDTGDIVICLDRGRKQALTRVLVKLFGGKEKDNENSNKEKMKEEIRNLFDSVDCLTVVDGWK